DVVDDLIEEEELQVLRLQNQLPRVTLASPMKIYVGENKKNSYSRISIDEIVKQSKLKEKAIKNETKENPLEFSPEIIKQLTKLYNDSMKPNIYPKRSMKDTPLKNSMGEQILKTTNQRELTF